jgi:hypothetical protein
VAGGKRKGNGQGTKRSRLRYFFLNGDLHKVLEMNRGKDLIRAWNYKQEKVMVYNYTDTLRYHEPAFTTAQVCEIINRTRITLWRAMESGMIEKPQHVYTIDERRKMVKFMWHEKDILALLDALASVSRGRPRFDGSKTPSNDLPTPREVRAIIRHDGATLDSVRGNYTPAWKAKERL